MNYQSRQEGLKRVRRLLGIYRSQIDARDPESLAFYRNDGEFSQLLLKTRVYCSCYRCGNPRRHWGELTPQELRANEAMRAQLAECIGT